MRSPDVDMSFRREVDLASQDTLAPIAPWKLTDLAVFQISVSLLDLGMAIVERDVPDNLKNLHCLNDLQIGKQQLWQCERVAGDVLPLAITLSAMRSV